MTRVRFASEADIAAIIALQDANLVANVAPEVQAVQGFVTTPYTPEIMREFIAVSRAFVAENDGDIAGYVFAGAWAQYDRWAIFPYMVSRLETLPPFRGVEVRAEDSFQYGPICVAERMRGTGVPAALFAHVCETLAATHPLGVTFINKRNTRSLAAHQRKLGFAVIDEWEYAGESFYSLAFLTQANNTDE